MKTFLLRAPGDIVIIVVWWEQWLTQKQSR